MREGDTARARLLAEYIILSVWILAAILVAQLFPQSLSTVAVSTFGAVVAASLLIAWAAEASEFSIGRGFALAIVAIVQTIPEYFVEGTIAWKAGANPVQWLPNVIANFTGANRLLSGFGWPLILFTLAVQMRRKGRKGAPKIVLQPEQSVEVVFMLGASLYYVWILFEHALTIIDSIVFAGTFLVYMIMLARLPHGREEPEEALEAPSRALAEIKSPRRRLVAIAGIFAVGALTFVLITDSFVVSIQQLAQMFLIGFLGTGAAFFTIQWIAPVLSEFPEKVTAFNWARQITLAPVALLNFVSSSVNELSALVALIPIVFVISRGSLGTVPLSGQQWIEIFLTMAQSLYACAVLLDLSFDAQNAVILFALWIVSTAVIETRLVIAIIFLVLALYETVRNRGRIVAFNAFCDTLHSAILRNSN